MRPDDVTLFEQLAETMNHDTERFERFGSAEFVAALEMQRPKGESFRVRLVFEGVTCLDVAPLESTDPSHADFELVGPIDAWQAMFDDVLANGHATGLQTMNSLALMGDRIRLEGTDPMGLDKFSRYNQTLQEFFDGAARLGAPA